MIEKEYDYQHPILGDGYIRFQFNAKGLICGLKLSADLNEESTAKLVRNFPVSLNDLEFWRTRKSGKLTEYKQDVSFDEFYNKWGLLGGDKRNRMRCERSWKNLSGVNQRRAFRYLNRFFASIKPGLNIMHPDRYLREQIWND